MKWDCVGDLRHIHTVSGRNVKVSASTFWPQP